MADYRLEQQRFAHWCRASGRRPLPAGASDVLAYLETERPAGGTAARWIAAIRAAHRAAGLPDPCAGAPAAWVRRARNPATRHALPPEEVSRLAGPIPVAGWPGGLFGRRNRLALVLHHLGALPARSLVALRAEDIAVTGHAAVTVTADVPVTVTGPRDDPAACPACAVTRWGWVLRHAAYFNRPAIARRLREPPGDPALHICGEDAAGQPAGPAGWPLFPAADRWGHFPPPRVPAMSLRAMEGLLRDAASGLGVYRNLPVRAPKPDPPADPEPAPPAPPPANEQWYQDGVAARVRDRAALLEVTGKLDEIDVIAARLEELTRQLLEGETVPGTGM